MLGVTSTFAHRLLQASWPEIVSRVPPDLLPRQVAPPSKRKSRRMVFEEFGCGSYGCVMPTARENVVVKVTTDPTEIMFVGIAMAIGEWPEGIVKYFDAMPLEGKYKGRDVFLLWREEAYNVGQWLPSTFVRAQDRSYEENARIAFAHRLHEFKSHAHVVREILKRTPRPVELLAQAKQLEDWAFRTFGLEDVEDQSPYVMGSPMLRGQRGAYAVAARLRACEIVAEMMANEPEGYLVGQAFEFYLEHGLLLADVHSNNVGEVQRADHTKPVLAITDPGHVVGVK